ncbi:MAG: DUF3306 domain-containing protein [Pseudomonadota bacterium]
MTDTPKSFLARWSEKKRAGPEEEAAPEAPPLPEEEAEALSEAKLLEKLGLPEPDSLAPGDDFSAFMQAAVPQHLRTRALRRPGARTRCSRMSTASSITAATSRMPQQCCPI